MIEFKNGFAQEEGEISTYVFDTATGEYLGAGTAHVLVGTGLPAGATIEAPPDAPEGQVAVWQDGAWAVMADHRGTAYSTVDGAPRQYREVGDLPDTLTLLPKPGPAYVWRDANWVLDVALDLAIKARAEAEWMAQELHLAGTEIDKHEDQDLTAVASVESWRRYRVELRAWPQHGSFPDSTQRPVAPEASDESD